MGLRVAFFGYSWAPDQKLDAYQQALVDAFVKKGAQVEIFLANYMPDGDLLRGIKPQLIQPILSHLKNFNPTLIVSMNRGGLTQEMKASVSAPVITWIVDDLAHLFDPDGNNSFAHIATDKDPVIISSYELMGLLLKECPSGAKNIHFLPSATDYQRFRTCQLPKKFNLSFVGSYLSTEKIGKFIEKQLKDPKDIQDFCNILDQMSKNYRFDFDGVISNTNLGKLANDMSWSTAQLRLEMACILSAKARLDAVDATCDLGLALFGGESWLSPILTHNYSALKSFQRKQKVRSHQDLIEVYQSSKICFNVSQIQTPSALSYRSFDILASDALLIQPYHSDSDAFKIFGNDCPIPMYKNLEELRSLCEYYLANETERLEKVRQCHEIIKKGFSFDDRVVDLIRIVGKQDTPPHPEPGFILRKPEWFERSPFRLKFWKLAFRKLVVKFLTYTISRKNRMRLAHQLMLEENEAQKSETKNH